MKRPLSIDIAICTFRRSSIVDTMRSIATLQIPADCTIRVIVADNDSVPSAKVAVETLAAEMPCEVSYVHCPASNISLARNACLDHAEGDYLAFVDDDELVTPTWLKMLIAKAQTTGAAAVLGPVMARYDETAPAFMISGDFHSTKPVFVKGEIGTGYTCNLLLDRRSDAFVGKRFDLSLGRCGGEDTAFLASLHAAGGKIAYAPDALVVEPVPTERASIRWLARRRFRSGQSHARTMLAGATGLRAAPQIILAAGKGAVCFAACATNWFTPVHRWRHYLRGVLHLGVIAGLFGLNEAVLYGNSVVVERSTPHGA